MKRSHTQPDTPKTVALLPELVEAIGQLLEQPWFTDLRAYLRWQQCSKTHWILYCAKDFDALAKLYAAKLEYQRQPCYATRHVEATLNSWRLERAHRQAALMHHLGIALQAIPSRVQHKGAGLIVTGPDDLNRLIAFQDFTSQGAIDELDWCCQCVASRYGWELELLSSRGVERRPWRAQPQFMHLRGMQLRAKVPRKKDLKDQAHSGPAVNHLDIYSRFHQFFSI